MSGVVEFAEGESFGGLRTRYLEPISPIDLRERDVRVVLHPRTREDFRCRFDGSTGV